MRIKMEQQSDKIDWVIILEANDCSCDICGRREKNFIKGYCNATTDGMFRYKHPEFQLVLQLEYKLLLYTLNTLGLMVKAGRKFQDGDLVDELFEGYQVKLKGIEDGGKQVLRVIIPDPDHRFPDDPLCQLEYSYQALPIEDLYIANTNNKNQKRGKRWIKG